MSLNTEISRERHRAVRVLVADSDNDTRSRYCESLRAAGCDVVDATDGRDALVKALSHRPALVITETRLPIFDGYALCEVLRRDSTTRGVPILVVTAETRPRELERARDAGADRVVTKPISLDALLSEVQRLLWPAERLNEPAPGTPAAGEHRASLAKRYPRFETTSPPARPPDLVCPSCDTPLVYAHSHIGGVSRKQPEQWDLYTCPASCGTFEYRQRTRKIRRVA